MGGGNDYVSGAPIYVKNIYFLPSVIGTWQAPYGCHRTTQGKHMADLIEDYLARAAEARAAASLEVLANVREKHLTAAATWDDLARSKLPIEAVNSQACSTQKGFRICWRYGDMMSPTTGFGGERCYLTTLENFFPNKKARRFAWLS